MTDPTPSAGSVGRKNTGSSVRSSPLKCEWNTSDEEVLARLRSLASRETINGRKVLLLSDQKENEEIGSLLKAGKIERLADSRLLVGTWVQKIVLLPLPKKYSEPNLSRYSQSQRKIVDRAIALLNDASVVADETSRWADFDPKIVSEALKIWLEKKKTKCSLSPAYALAIMHSLSKDKKPKPKKQERLNETQRAELSHIIEKYKTDNPNASWEETAKAIKRIEETYVTGCRAVC